MTISADYGPNIDLGNGVTTVFAVNFPFGAKADLLVTLFTIATAANVSPAPVLNGAATYDYAVSGTPNPDTGIYPSGSVTFNTAPPAGCKVVRERATPQRQNTSLTSNGPFPAKTVEGMVDRDEMQLQETGSLLSRTLHASAAAQPSSMEIPAAWFLGGTVLAFDPTLHIPTVQDPMVTAATAAAAAAAASAATAVAAAAAAGANAWARPVLSILPSPPAGPAVGDRYLVDPFATAGAWVGKQNQVAEWSGLIWIYSGAPGEFQTVSMQGVVLQYQRDVYRGLLWREKVARLLPFTGQKRIKFFGDSIAVGNGASGNPKRYSTRLATLLGASEDNYAVGGTGVVNQILQMFVNLPGFGDANGLVVLEGGHNDAISANARTPQTVENVYTAALCSHFSATAVAGSDAAVTKSSGWTDGNSSLLDKASFALGGHIQVAGASGKTLTWAFTGDSLAVHCYADDGSLGSGGMRQFSLSIDGAASINYDGNGVAGANAELATRSHAVVLARGLGQGAHTVILTTGNAGASTGGVNNYIDTFATLIEPSRAKPILILLPPRPSNFAAVGTGLSTPQSFDLIDQAIRNAAAKFSDYPVMVVRTADWLDRAQLPDGTHPNDTGHEQVARACESYCSPDDTARFGTWVPSFVGFTFSGGYGINAYYQVTGRVVECWVHIAPFVAQTVAWAVASSANFTLPPNLPLTEYSTGEARNITTKARICGGLLYDPNRFWLDADLGATNNQVLFHFSYLIP